MTFTYPPFYDVEVSVGNGAANQTVDVMLVQYFLFSILIDASWPLAFAPVVPADVTGPGAIFPVDGEYQSDLALWTSAFQQFANANGMGTLTVDGVVSHGGAAWGRVKPRAANWWTIHAMNHLLFVSDKERFRNLPSDASIPGPLQEALRFMVDVDPVP